MCTVTVVPAGDAAFRIVCNRDERLTRAAADSPELHHLGLRTAIYPTDPAGGGTWIGVNDAGLAAVILNRTESHFGASAGLRACRASDRLSSRGLIVPRCLACGDLDDALRSARDIALDQFAPFSLVIVQRRDVAVANSQGRELSIDRTVLRTPRLFTSSSLGDEFVDGPRRLLFEQLVGAESARWLGRQARFHEHQWPERPDISVRMKRHDAVTVSRSIVDVTPQRIRLRYEAVVPRPQAA